MRRWLTLGAAFLLGVFWLVYKGGGHALNPHNYDWMVGGDWGQHQLGWAFYRKDVWHFPLGRMTNFPDPTGATTPFTDSIPWVALLLKPFSRLLPARFQYLGPYLGLSFGLQAVFGTLLVGRLSTSRSVQLAGGVLFAVAPLVLFRVGHIALGSHYLLLAALWIILLPSPTISDARRLIRWMGLALVVAAGVHPYLTAMVSALLLALLVRLWRVERLIGLAYVLVAFLLVECAAAFIMFALGYFVGADVPMTSYRDTAADLLTFINPMGRGTLLPSIELLSIRYEGFAYLGVGVLILSVLGLISFVRDFRSHRLLRRHWPLFTTCGLLSLYAFSTKLTMGKHVLLDVDVAALHPITTIFRSSGRFIWPLHDLILLGAIAGTLALLRGRPRLQLAALLAALTLQVVDQSNAVSWTKILPDTPPRRPIPDDPRWSLAQGQYRRIAMAPPLLLGCAAVWEPYDDQPIGFLADQLGMTVNSARLARPFPAREQAYCAAFDREIATGRFADDTIYVVHPTMLSRFATAVCGTINERTICVSPTRTDAFRRALEANAGPGR